MTPPPEPAQHANRGIREFFSVFQYSRAAVQLVWTTSRRLTIALVLLSLAEAELQFRVAGATLPDGELPSLDWIANLLNEHRKLTARIEGHSDSSGREETNPLIPPGITSLICIVFTART